MFSMNMCISDKSNVDPAFIELIFFVGWLQFEARFTNKMCVYFTYIWLYLVPGSDIIGVVFCMQYNPIQISRRIT